MHLLSIHRTYYHYANIGQYVYADLPLKHYPFHTDNITMSLVVAWFMQHGMNKDSEVLAQMESFSRSHCNLRTGKEIPTLPEFDSGGFPCNAHNILSIMEANIILWATICHATLQEGITSTYPESPADTMVNDSG
ncbi:hypothetical protein C8R44DRAFT_884828 [Mycena epipterygia]|nr:hypothetical protein C8R44DRAFT_884828 [Mycena epipterygia]